MTSHALEGSIRGLDAICENVSEGEDVDMIDARGVIALTRIARENTKRIKERWQAALGEARRKTVEED